MYTNWQTYDNNKKLSTTPLKHKRLRNALCIPAETTKITIEIVNLNVNMLLIYRYISRKA